MAKVRVKINSNGAVALMRSSEVLSDLMARGEAIAKSANAMASPDDMDNDAYMADGENSGTRAKVRVFTSSPHGIRNNNKHNTLLKSLDAGR